MSLQEINRDIYTRLFENCVRAEGFPRSIINIYDHSVLKRVPERIMANPLILQNGNEISFKNVRPQLYTSGKVKKPFDVLEQSDTSYLIEFVGDIEKKEGGRTEVVRDITLARVPAMLACEVCALRDKSPEQLIELGECPSDPFGYFRTRSSEKILVIQEKLRNSKIFIFGGGGKSSTGKSSTGKPTAAKSNSTIDCRTTLPCRNGTVVTQVHVTEHQSFRVQLSYAMKKTHIPVYGLFFLLGKDVQATTAMILKFIPPEYQLDATQILLPSIHDFNTIGRNTKNAPMITDRRDRLIDWINYWRTEDKLTILAPDRLQDDLLYNLFPNLPESDQEGKLLHMAHMIGQLVKYLLKIRPLDNRDSWSNKRLDSAGKHIETLFNIMWDNHLKSMRDANASSLISFAAKDIEKDMITAFNPGAWGIKKSTRKDNYVDIMKRETSLAVKQQISKVNTPTSHRDPRVEVREVQPSQLGFIDASETPEGDVIGLVKNIAISLHISYETNPQDVIRVLTNDIADFYPQYQNIFMYPVLVDGIICGWVEPEKAEMVRRELVAHRRRGRIGKDVCIVLDSESGQIEIYCNSSRPTHPVLIVDEHTQRLAVEVKGIDLEALLRVRENESKEKAAQRVMDYLVNEGCIEFLDANEQEFCFLAENPRNFLIKQRMKLQYPQLMAEFAKERDDEFMLARVYKKLAEKGLANPETLKLNQKLEKKYQTETLKTLQDYSDQEKVDFKDQMNLEIQYLQNQLDDIPQYTHCSIDALDMFSIMCSLAPKANHQLGPRTSYQAGMIRQALGMYHSVHWKRFDVGYKILLHPSRPIFEVATSDIATLTEMPATTNLIVAYKAEKENQEDGIIMNENCLHRFMLYKYFTNKIVVTINSGGSETEAICLPEILNSQKERYHALDKNGLPIPGKTIKDKDFILGRVRKDHNDIQNASVAISYTEEGIIDRVSVENLGTNKCIVKIKVRALRTYQEGDKFAARYSQKGVCAQVRKFHQMPQVIGGPNDGVKPDILINPHGMPSRMTMGMVDEIAASKASLWLGVRIDGTTYKSIFGFDNERNHQIEAVRSVQEEIMKTDLPYVQKVLYDNGMRADGTEIMMYADGSFVQTPIQLGVCAYAALRHHSIDKFQARGSEGSVHVQTHQPVAGRSKHGGIRFGEMERDAIISHGGSSTIRECLCIGSDYHEMVFCATCGIPPTYKNAIGDRAPAYQCKRCGLNDFCIVPISYTMKYLMHLLLAMNIETSFDLRKITDQERLLM